MERGQAGTIMSHFVLFVGLCFLLGGLAVASNPSLYSEDAGLMLQGVDGAISFMSLVLCMVYLGGMSVDYVYSSSLVADPFQRLGGILR